MSVRDNLDLAWREALTGYLPEFLALFLPEVHDAIDGTHPVEFLDTETRRLRRPPRGRPWTLRGQRRVVDLVAKVRLREGQDVLVLVHVEVQARFDPDMPLRMRLYNDRLFDITGLPVFSLVVLADSNPGWRPDRHEVGLWGCRSTLEFPVIKLLDWQERRAELEASTNPFALVVAATLAVLETRPNQPARLHKALRLVRLLLERGFRQDQIDGLFHLLEVIMPMSDRLTEDFTREVIELEKKHASKLVSPLEMYARKKERMQGHREAIQVVLRARFGETPSDLAELLEARRDSRSLSRLMERAATADSLSDFMAELKEKRRRGA